MRLARLAPLALAAVPAAALAAMSSDEVNAEASKLPPQVPGRYRTSFELIELDAPGNSKDLAESMRAGIGKGEARNNETCVTPEEASRDAGSQLVETFAEGNCAFDRLVVTGETISAVLQCPAGPDDQPMRLKLSGRAGAEAVDMLVTVEQKFPDKSTLRMTMRVTSERIGECS